jgi:hypothetical protein
MLREDLGPSVEAHSRRWELVVNAYVRGFNDLQKLRSHPDSRFLLSREDLGLLIMDMAFPDRPFRDQ